MEIAVSREDAKVTVTVKGEINSVTAAKFGETLNSLPITEIKLLLLDFAEVEYISSAGLRVLLGTYDQMQDYGVMKIIHVNDDVLQIFDITGFNDMLDIEAE